jgi:hypothetical protein
MFARTGLRDQNAPIVRLISEGQVQMKVGELEEDLWLVLNFNKIFSLREHSLMW